MRGQMNYGALIALAVILLIGLTMAGVVQLPKSSGFHQSTTEVTAPAETAETGAGEPQPVTIKQTTTAETWTVKKVAMRFVSALDPRKAMGGFDVEILPLDAIPSDPMRNIVDKATVDSNGVAVFTGGVLEVGKKYQLVVRGGTIVYDKSQEIKVPMLPPEIQEYTFPEKVKVMPVAHFADINVDTPKEVEWNIAGETGVHYRTINIKIGVSDATPEGAIKNPVLVFRTPEDAELDPGAIVHIYVTRLQGTDFGIPPVDLAGYLASESPIALKGSFTFDEDPSAVYMTAADSAVYQVKIGYDADSIDGGEKLMIALDDLGDYKASDITNERKAPTEALVITFVK